MANTQIGQVVKLSTAQTVTVKVVAYRNHPVYKKRYIYSKKYLVHDPQGLAKLEDRVVIRQSRPVSRRKRWQLEKVVTVGGHQQEVKSDLQAIEAEAAPVVEKEPPVAARKTQAAAKPAAEKDAKKPPVKPAAKAEAKPAARKTLPAKPVAKKPTAKQGIAKAADKEAKK